MSVVRVAYRQILKRIKRVSLSYDEPNHVCFTVFGVMLRLDDFAAAQYGDTPQKVIRSVFLRPSITGLASDTPAVRLTAAFDILRRLNDAVPLKEGVNEHAQGHAGTTSTCHSPEGALKNGKAAGGRGAQGRDKKTAPDENTHIGHDDVATVANGTIFIEGSVSRKVRKISRNVIFSMFFDRLPPYRLTIPPEPLYTKNMRVSFKFPLMVDALLCMSASANICSADACRVVVQMNVKTKQEYCALCDSIPTRTVTVTDHVEVEVRTEYVCSRTPDEDEGPSAFHDGGSALARRGGASGALPSMEHVFRYFVFIRNYGSDRNAKKWHIQLLSRHWVVFDEEVGHVTEVIGPGVAGNFPLLAPGESHTYESGVSLSGTSGVMRGTFQLNAYNEDGESRCIDVHIGPTRLYAHNASPVTV